MLNKPTPLQKYAVAIVVVLVAFALRYKLYGTLDHRLPFSFFLPATIIAAWYGGLGPGLLAAVGGLLLGDYFFLPRHAAGDAMGEPERTAIGLYAVNCALIVLLFSRLHMRLRQANHELTKLKSGGGQPG
jgi:two-component system sensor histidine kinase/response regulator